MRISIFMYTYVCTVSKDIGINKEKEINVTNKESISGNRCERTTMTVKCVQNVVKIYIGICMKQI